MPRREKAKLMSASSRHDPLGDQIERDVERAAGIVSEGSAAVGGRKAKEDRARKERVIRHAAAAAAAAEAGVDEEELEEDEQRFLPRGASRKILLEAQRQRQEIEEEERMRLVQEQEQARGKGKGKRRSGRGDGHGTGRDDDDDDDGEPVEEEGADLDLEEDDDEEEEIEEVEVDLDGDGEGLAGLVQVDGSYVSSAGLSEAEEQVVNNFLFSDVSQRRTLADMIMEKIAEKEEREREIAAGGGLDAVAEAAEAAGLAPKVVDVYSRIGSFLSSYTSGKVPKALKMVPHLKNWEEVLWLTRPDTWTPHATFACTRIFASNLNAKMAQRFYSLVLLDKVREDIMTNKRLNYHYYIALKKAMYKPAAFFKGIILPLAAGGDCTLREATIIGSVMAKVSIPMIHSAAALVKLAEMPYSGSNSVFIRILISKKYSLPRRVVAALVQHFVSFVDETRQLPVLWHQALLTFAQRYKFELTSEQKEGLKALLRVHQHYLITPEVRRELFGATARDEILADWRQHQPVAMT